MKPNPTTERLAIIGIMLAVFFGILNYFPQNPKFNLGMDLMLYSIANIFFKFTLFFFIMYLTGLAIDRFYKSKYKHTNKISLFFYEFGVLTLFIGVIWIISYLILIKVLVWLSLNSRTNQIIFILYFAIVAIIGGSYTMKSIHPYYEDLVSFIKKKIRK